MMDGSAEHAAAADPIGAVPSSQPVSSRWHELQRRLLAARAASAAPAVPVTPTQSWRLRTRYVATLIHRPATAPANAK